MHRVFAAALSFIKAVEAAALVQQQTSVRLYKLEKHMEYQSSMVTFYNYLLRQQIIWSINSIILTVDCSLGYGRVLTLKCCFVLLTSTHLPTVTFNVQSFLMCSISLFTHFSFVSLQIMFYIDSVYHCVHTFLRVVSFF